MSNSEQGRKCENMTCNYLGICTDQHCVQARVWFLQFFCRKLRRKLRDFAKLGRVQVDSSWPLCWGAESFRELVQFHLFSFSPRSRVIYVCSVKVPLKGRVSQNIFSFVGPVGHNIWWENIRNDSFGPETVQKCKNSSFIGLKIRHSGLGGVEIWHSGFGDIIQYNVAVLV